MIGAFRWLYGRLTEKLYREWSGLYDTVSTVVSLGRWDAWRRRALAYTSGGDVLELGFGTGHLLAAMAGAGRRGVGADVSPAMAARAARRLRSEGAPAAVVQAHAQALPFGEGSFDTVVSTFPAAYILAPETLQEAARVLRSAREGGEGGRLVVVGLWSDTTCWPLRVAFAPFYGSPDWGALASYAQAWRGAGFAPAIVEERDGGFSVGGIVAVRRGR